MSEGKWVETLTPAGVLEKETCLWDADDDGVWTAECHKASGEGPSFTFEDGGPIQNRFAFCPYCGKPLLVSKFAAE